MTTIAAIRERKIAILVGADSGQKDLASGARTKCAHKLDRHPILPIVWGVSGNGSVAESFGREMKTYHPRTWEQLQAKAVKVLTKCNRRQRDVASKSGKEDSLERLNAHRNVADVLTGSVLVAGYLDGELSGFTVDCWGQDSSFHDDLSFVGAAAKELCVGYHVVRKLHGKVTSASFHKILETVAETVDGCDPPIHIVRIDNKGIKTLY
jgi:hypothetical protein